MKRPVRSILLAAGLLAGPAGALAQTAEDHIRLGVAAHDAFDPVAELREIEAALAIDSLSYVANWRASEALMDIGKQTPDSVPSPERDSAYARAEVYARRAVALDSMGADGHYVLAAAIGRASLTKSKKERVRRASEIRAEALRAIALDSNYDKAYHVLGRWNAEIMRLSGLTRFFAKTFLGAKIFHAASWDSAVVYMDKAVALAPQSLYHHLDLAEILIDLGRYREARIHLNQVLTLSPDDVMAPTYKARAEFLLHDIEGKEDRGD
ncbi:MAG TPA: tetratricopeptide repeat protein [Gemmatimonadales bacterium]|nr:tetratricopeptide repeat protein [Gemmatimonadales bacterium]